MTCRRLAAALLVPAFATAAWYSSCRLIAAACSLGESQDLRSFALTLEPTDAAAQLRYAGVWKASDRHDLVKSHLEAAVASNPRLTAARVWLANEMEFRDKDPIGAERMLQTAAALDRQFDPAWALANFYLRRGRDAEFRDWLERAAGVAYDDGRPLYALALQVGLPAQYVLSRLVRQRPAFERALLLYAIDVRSVDWVHEAGKAVVDHSGPDDKELLAKYCEFELYQGRVSEAVRAWNRLSSMRLIPYGPLQAGSVINSDFRQPLTSYVFDWHVLSPAVYGVRVPGAEGLRFDFTNLDRDACDVLSQIVAVEPGVTYRVSVTYWMSEPGAGAGFRMSAISWPHHNLLATRELAGEEGRHNEVLTFRSPDSQAARLLFSYIRPAALKRFRGEFQVASVRID